MSLSKVSMMLFPICDCRLPIWSLVFGIRSLAFVAFLTRTVNGAKTKDLRPKAKNPRPINLIRSAALLMDLLSLHAAPGGNKLTTPPQAACRQQAQRLLHRWSGLH